MNFIDLFAGAGGLSDGFLRNGFTCYGHIEMMEQACETLKTRESFYYLKKKNRLSEYDDYLSGKISREEFRSAVPKELLDKVICCAMSKDNLKDLFRIIDNNRKGNEIDVVLGGPPCQAYSFIGRARTDMSNDPRNHLYLLYLEFLRHLRPKAFVFENVKGLISAGNGKYCADLKKQCSDLGYALEGRLLKAEDYGILQHRRREIILGIRQDLYALHPDFPFPAKETERFSKYTIQDLFSDLPPLQPGETDNHYLSKPSEYLEMTGIRTEADHVLTWHTTRPISEHDRNIYRFVIEYNQKYGKNPKYTDLPLEWRTHKNQSSFLDRFKMVPMNAHTSQTMVAHIAKDGHYFIYPDAKQARSLSVREAARIQSFPDNYFFEGARTSAFTQIGNAVPPLLASALGKSIKSYLEHL